MKRIPCCLFTQEFKREAIKLVTDQDLTLAQAGRKLDVAKSGYQHWRMGKAKSERQLEDARLVVAIKAAHQRGRGIYGPKKIRTELAEQGMPRRNCASPPTLSIIYPLLRICWIDNSPVLRPIRCGWPISPTFPPRLVGFIWQRSRICIPAKSLAGR